MLKLQLINGLRLGTSYSFIYLKNKILNDIIMWINIISRITQAIQDFNKKRYLFTANSVSTYGKMTLIKSFV